MITLCKSENSKMDYVCCHFRGRQIGTFKVEAEWVAENLHADPRLDPFEVTDRLRSYFQQALSMRDLNALYIIESTYDRHRIEVLRTHLGSELDRYERRRAWLTQQLEEAMDYESDIRIELQSLPIKTATSEEVTV